MAVLFVFMTLGGCNGGNDSGGGGGNQTDAPGSPSPSPSSGNPVAPTPVPSGGPSGSPTPSPSPSSTPTSTPAPGPTTTSNPGPVGRALPSWLWGVTVTDPWSDLPGVLDSLRHMPAMPVARIVFDENVAASEYKNVVAQMKPVSYLMGELLDSYYMKSTTTDAFKARVNDYVKAYSSQVDLWEIGNEVNGEWLGTTASVVQKVTDAYNIVRAAGGKTALTLYYNQDCWANAANEMFTWTQTNIPASMKQNLDYVLVSYYEDDCNGLKPDWPTVFKKLATLFPNSKLGFGEVGTTVASKKADYLTRYYSLKMPEVPSYVGGYFWWYFNEDMVPYSKSLFNTLTQYAK